MTSRFIPLGPFTYTTAGDLGEHRDPMLSNVLLLKDRAGQPRSRGFYLPGKGFSYGKPNEKRDYTALDALRGWTGCFKVNEYKPTKNVRGRDFAALNRAAVSAGLVSAKEHYDYRVTHDYRLKPPPDPKSRTLKFPAHMTFGRPGRPSTPMFDILEHRYQDKWIKQRHNQTQAKREKQSKRKSQLVLYDTRASLLRTYQNPVDHTTLWQMPKFKNNAKPHLQTFRTCSEKCNALSADDFDQVSRKGTLGQGIYEAAKN